MKFAQYLMGLCLLGVLSGGAEAKESLTLGMPLEPPGLDPTSGAAGAIDEVVYANVFEGLTRYRADGDIAPGLAQSWTISDDGLKYRFHLHEGVTFHDGTVFDAEDVKFSLDRARGADSTNAQKQLFAGITDIEVIDALTVDIMLDGADGDFITKLAWGDAVILAAESAEHAATEPIGTGPFRFSQWAKGDRVELLRHADYWGEAVALERVTFKFISEPTAAFAAMMAGAIDAYPAYPAPETLAQFEADPRFQVITGSTEGETILAMNNTSGVLADIRVRRAIAHALDRRAIIDGAMFGFGVPIGSHFAPHHPAYIDLTEQSAFDPQKSKALLAEAGVGSITLSLKLPPPSYARRGGEIIASQLRAVGIETEIENLEWAQWLEQVFKNKDYDLTIVSHTEPMDIGIYAKPDYYFQYDSPGFRVLMARLKQEADAEARAEILAEAQRHIADDYVNGYLFQLARTGVADVRLEGLWQNAPTQANDLTGVVWTD